jgi:hypothetical protein
MKLEACPFCEGEELEVEVTELREKPVFNRQGVLRKYGCLTMRVVCYSCGATGPHAQWKEPLEVTLSIHDEIHNAAVMLWNARGVVRAAAINAVNQILNLAFEKVGKG